MLSPRYHLISSIRFYYNFCSFSMATATSAPNPIFYFSRKLSTSASPNNGLAFVNNNPSISRLRGCLSSGNKFDDAISNSNARVFSPTLDTFQLSRDSGRVGDDQLGSKVFNGQDSFKGLPPNKFADLPDKISVAVDVDEVLGNFLSAINEFVEDQYSAKHSISEYHVYEFFKIWNCSRNEADVRVHEFFKTSYFTKGIYPIPGALEALQKLTRFCDLSIVTSRQNIIKDHTIEWIEKHYPGIFKEIHFGNHFALDGTSRPKSDICRSLGAKVLIDDNPKYAIECASAGIRVLLFDFEDAYPWSKMDTIDQHPLITKVINWKEVEHQMESWIVS